MPSSLPEKLRALAHDFARQAQSLALEPTGTWAHTIDFAIDEINEGGNLILNVHATGKNEDIYRAVDEGTEKRYNVMTKNFVPKTSVRSLKSTTGRGGFAYLSVIALPGIQAREFSAVVAETLQEPFSKAVGKILRKR